MNCGFRLLLWMVMCKASIQSSDTYPQSLVGVGRADCTGPSAEITFMGYAKSEQKGCGIHLRQFSRAFYFQYQEKPTSDIQTTVFVSVDACMINTGLKQAVIQKFNQNKKRTFDLDNKTLVLSGTHTHNGPGGFLQDVMLDVPNLGFVKETFDVLVDGIAESIYHAWQNAKEADIYLAKGDVTQQTNRNRSPTSYEHNPDKHDYKGNTDVEMVQLKFCEKGSPQKCFGAINWFPVHPTSMNNTNCLVSSDNVGYASILLENSIEPTKLPGKTDFVGAFASTNLGDVSPNLKEPICTNTGLLCDKEHSTCDGQNKYCVSFGPGKDIFESTEIIAKSLFNTAKGLLNGTSAKKIEGPMESIHQYVKMSDSFNITLNNGTQTTVKGCKPAMGYGFAGGTTDGPGEFDFKQATNTTNPFWNFVRDFIFPPSPEDVECHAPKPILIMSGNIHRPYEWQPEVVATQIFRIGNVFIAAVPGEFTTMSGRRMKKRIAETISSAINLTDITVIIAGLSNTYTNYIATPEEYTVQRYEAASTIFGPHTLDIYLNQYSELAKNLVTGQTVTDLAQPYEFPTNLYTLVPPVLFDTSGWEYNFGDCIQQPHDVEIGEIVSAKFIAGHPRNDPMRGKTFLEVQKLDANVNNWTIVANDASWDTKFIWRRVQGIVGSSEAEIVWDTKNAEEGTYKIVHYGNYKYIFGRIVSYTGQTNDFKVTKKNKK